MFSLQDLDLDSLKYQAQAPQFVYPMPDREFGSNSLEIVHRALLNSRFEGTVPKTQNANTERSQQALT